MNSAITVPTGFAGYLPHYTVSIITGEKSAALPEKRLESKLFRRMLLGGITSLRAQVAYINRLNVFPVPDGDTGDNMRMTYEGGIASIEQIADTADLGALAKSFSHGMLLGARGNSGVILSQFFGGIADGLSNRKDASLSRLGKAFDAGVHRAYSAVLHPAEGTVLSVAREAVAFANRHLAKDSTVLTYFTDLYSEMNRALQRTPDQLPVLREAGVVDSGGAGLLTIVEGFCRVLKGEEIPAEAPVQAEKKVPPTVDIASVGADFEMSYGYCTELLLQLQNSKGNPDSFDLGALQTFLSELGDSIVTFREGTVVKLHVHTKTPEKVLAYCRQYGELLTVKIENMSLQHTETTISSPVSAPEATAEPTVRKPVAVVAVVSGSGIEELFRELGADAFVSGGQSDNPSTQDFLNAYSKIEAEDIFVLPNNGNILLAARQSAELYTKARIHVLEARDIGAGYAALSVFAGGESDPAALEEAAKAAMQATCTGLISPAVRDATLDGIHIRQGDFIGFSGKKMLLSESDCHRAAFALAGMLLAGKERFMLTVLCGQDVTPDESERLASELQKAYPDKEFYFARGEQAVYPYIMIAE